MALSTNGKTAMNGAVAPPVSIEAQALDNRSEDVHLADIDPSKLTINLTDSPKPLPEPSSLVFGQTMTDHMLVTSFDPITGWTAPYCPNVFEGMKAYLGPDGTPRLFRPQLNMARMKTSVDRVALPTFDENALLTLIQKLVHVERRWIPKEPGYSLYIRPTIIGTRPSLGVAASTHALLYIILSPTGPYFGKGVNGVSLLAVHEQVRSWPGGTGGFKLGLNYAPCFEPQRRAAQRGYMQVLWLLGEDRRITEAGAMNFFVVVKRDDGDLDVVTPPLDGTILPGVTRASVLALVAAHSPEAPLSGLPPSLRLHTHERTLTMPQIKEYSERGVLSECFSVGTAVIVAPVTKIGYEDEDLVMPKQSNVANALLQKLEAIQEGRLEWEGWSVKC